MAVSKIVKGFMETLRDDFNNFFTPETGFTFTQVSIRQVGRDLFYLYLAADGAVPAGPVNIDLGTFDISVFNNIAITGAFTGTLITSQAARIPVTVQIFGSGKVTLFNGFNNTGTGFTAQGIAVRREV